MSTCQWINHLKSPHFATVIKLYPPEELDLPVYIVDVSLDDDEVAGNHNYQDVSRVPAEKDTLSEEVHYYFYWNYRFVYV